MSEVTTFYKPKEVAALLKVNERTVRRWIEEGKLLAWHFGRQLRIPAEAIKRFGQPVGSKMTIADQDWVALATDSFAKDWENEKDAEYDHFHAAGYGI